jgi:hypothetical protein
MSESAMKIDKDAQEADKALANLILIYLNLLWIFGVLWSSWGLAPVLILAMVINHFINRTEVSRLSNRHKDVSAD